jgi:acetyl-CoA C-acetyltransferase
METIKDKVAIIGMGCSQFGENWDKSADDMIIDAVYEAYDDAGLGREDIQAVWVGTAFSGIGGICVGRELLRHRHGDYKKCNVCHSRRCL